MQQPDLLLEFLDVFRHLASARQATLALHLEPLERRSLFLANAGDAEALPELIDEDAAWQFVSSHLSTEPDENPVTEFASAEAGGTLLRVSFRRLLPQPISARRESGERRQDPVVRTAPPCDGALWIGMRDAKQVARLVAELKHDIEDGASTEAALEMLTGVCFRMAWSVYYLSSLTLDPVSRLPGRTHMQVFLRRAISAMRSSSRAISLMLINPDDFAMINCRHGRGRGDAAIREIAGSLESTLRSTDGLFRYSGAVFAAVLPATDLDQSRVTAEKVRRELSSHGYLDDDLPLTFSVGAAVALPDDLENFDDLERMLCDGADAALNSARLSGGAQSRVTGLKLEDHERAAMNPLTGIFAADTEKDYRNMLLLWDTVALVSTQNEPSAIAAAFVDRLAVAFRPDRLGLLQRGEEGFETMASSLRDETAPDNRVAGRPLRLNERSVKLVADAIETGQVARSLPNGSGAAAYAVPLVSNNQNLGCLFMDGRADTLKIDSSDVVFLNALASQMAVAIDRAELASRQIEEKDRESRSLRREVQGLRKALNHSKLVYQSDAMHDILQLLSRVAPTDATVLIIGESGTGKEVLAQSVHELSNRRDEPFVVFDCGAVAASLLEAELFGHTKGAYTGADRASEGHIARAEGGTLFLDEIGELPLAIQAKLLRFVQEKQFSPVGSAKTRSVDVRIVAATNRELDKEVVAGRFRADLYYRLRVIAVDAPPLRERPDDILPLAHYFMEKFAAQNGKPVHELAADVAQKLRQHHWPGNVRELQNTILRAVLTHHSGTLDAASIDLQASGTLSVAPAPSASPEPLPVQPSVVLPKVPALAAAQPAAEPAPTHIAPTAAAPIPAGDPWHSLQQELERQVELAVANNERRPAPLGRWLSEDLILHANEVCGSVARQAAQLVQVPESTFRRQLEKASADAANGVQVRSDSWATVRPLIRKVVEKGGQKEGEDGNLLDRSRHTLLRCVRSKVGGRTAAAASLMGVTPMTYKRWLADQENRS
ncbi:MAG: sigma 54-interacting transcriptional regulator [Pseudomonadota bacterium]